MIFKKIADAERNQDATVYAGNLDENVDQSILYELFLQCGPIKSVNVPKDRVTHTHQGYGFVEFRNAGDTEYAEKVLNGTKLFGKSLRVKKTGAHLSGSSGSNKELNNTATIFDLQESSRTIDVGANLFVGNLDALIDEAFLEKTFAKFGTLAKRPSLARDSQGNSKGYAFVSYTDFEGSDSAVREMDGQILMNKAVRVDYAFKKLGTGRNKVKERHGDESERLLAKQAKQHMAV